jgi:hypothetical protein
MGQHDGHACAMVNPQLEPLLAIFKPESDLHGDLEMANLAVDQVATDFCDLEPVQLAERGVGTCDAVADCSVNAVWRRPDDLGDAIRVVHGNPLGRRSKARELPNGSVCTVHQGSESPIVFVLERGYRGQQLFPRGDGNPTDSLGGFMTGTALPDDVLESALVPLHHVLRTEILDYMTPAIGWIDSIDLTESIS